MNEEYIDWKSRALVAEAETLNLKNLCAHHGICTTCGEYYIHHHNEPFATCNCNTSEWYELTEYMKLQDELRKLREQNPIGEYEYYDSGKCLAYVDKTKAKYGCHDLYAAANPAAILELIQQRDELLAALEQERKRLDWAMKHEACYYQWGGVWRLCFSSTTGPCDEDIDSTDPRATIDELMAK